MKTFLIPTAVKNVNNRLTKLGYGGLSLRSMELLSQLARAGLYNDNLVQHYMAVNGVQQSQNAVSSWLNLAPSRISLNKNLVQGTAANMPTWLHYVASDGRYGYGPGIVGSYFSTPSAAPVSVTGDLDIRAQVAMNDWSPSIQTNLLSRFNGVGNQRSYRLIIQTNGALSLTTSADGISSVASASTVLLPTIVSDFGTLWVRATLDVDNGASGNTVTFYTSTNGVNWIQLGAPVVNSGVTSIFAGTSELAIGAVPGGGSEVLAGKLYRAQIYNGIQEQGGVLAFDFNPATYISGTTFLDSSANAATITLNGGAVVIAQSALYFDGSNDNLRTGPFVLNQPSTIFFVGKQVSWTLNEGIFDGLTQASGRIFQSATTPNIRANAGSSLAQNPDWPIQTNAIISVAFNGTTSSCRVNRGIAITGDAGAGNMGGLTVGADGGLGSFSNIAVQEILVFNTLLSPAQSEVVTGYLNDKYSLGL